jgi:hypothetical protein
MIKIQVRAFSDSADSYTLRVAQISPPSKESPWRARSPLKLSYAMEAAMPSSWLQNPFIVMDFRLLHHCRACRAHWTCRLWSRRPDGMRFSWQRVTAFDIASAKRRPLSHASILGSHRFDLVTRWTFPIPIQQGLQEALKMRGIEIGRSTISVPDASFSSVYPLDSQRLLTNARESLTCSTLDARQLHF